MKNSKLKISLQIAMIIAEVFLGIVGISLFLDGDLGIGLLMMLCTILKIFLGSDYIGLLKHRLQVEKKLAESERLAEDSEQDWRRVQTAIRRQKKKEDAQASFEASQEELTQMLQNDEALNTKQAAQK